MPSPSGKPTVYMSSTFVDVNEHSAALKIVLERAYFDGECMGKHPAFNYGLLCCCMADTGIDPK